MQFALIRAEWLRIRLVKSCFSDTEARRMAGATAQAVLCGRRRRQCCRFEGPPVWHEGRQVL